jgi:hypothetical protein
MEAVTFTSPQMLAIRANSGYFGVDSIVRTASASALSLLALPCGDAFVEATNKHSAIPAS